VCQWFGVGCKTSNTGACYQLLGIFCVPLLPPLLLGTCRNPGSPYLESMVFHWPHFYCVGENVHYHPQKCMNYFGHRKFLVNPRKVDAIQVHRPIEPKDGESILMSLSLT